MSRHAVSSILALATVLSACSDRPTPTASHQDNLGIAPPVESAYPATAHALREVASAIAVALNHEEARKAIRDAMRESPWGEHQLILQDFIETERGKGLLMVIANAIGVNQKTMATQIGALPRLDFYIPVREQRRNWPGASGAWIVAALNSDDGPFWLFNPAGKQLPSGNLDQILEQPFFVLYPVESKRPRASVHPTEQIGSYSDGTDAISLSHYAMGDSTEIPKVIVRFCDGAGGTPAGDIELIVKGIFVDEAGHQIARDIVDNYNVTEPSSCQFGINEEDVFFSEDLIHQIIPDNTDHFIKVEVWEDDCDCFGNDDDFYGSRKFKWHDNGDLENIDRPSDDYPWTSVKLTWTPIPPSVLTDVEVSPSFITVGVDREKVVTAEAIDQYGYGLDRTVDQWSVGKPWVVTVNPINANQAFVEWQGEGDTTVFAEIDGEMGNASVQAEGCTEEEIEEDQCGEA